MAECTTPNKSPRSAAPRIAPGIAPGTSTTGEILACYVCKRRKVKCDRQLPVCSLCRKLNIPCEYPTYAGRPGPKPGAKRRRLDEASESPGSNPVQSLSSRPVDPSSRFEARLNSVVSPGSSHSATRDGPLSRRDVPTPSSSSASTRVRRLSSHSTSAPIFSRIMYPSHEAQTRPPSPSTVDTPSDGQGGGPKITVQSVCDALKITKARYEMLMTSYFNNMTAFSLFKPGSIEQKFTLMRYHSDAEALIAAMFSFSARHCRNADDQDDNNDCPSPSRFAQIASNQLDESVEQYGDLRPPFWLLQAAILVTFYQLTLNVRSRSWKKLGDCIRYSYDVNLHMVDANHDPAETRDKVNIQRWSLLEERRRAWWAVWEMDVFASTIRRLPTAIDSSMNLTMLPVPDSCWFNDVYQESCFLAKDCSRRWKHLSKSGNTSAKAWFIVVNSLMRNTQRIVYPAGSAIQAFNEKGVEAKHDELSIMANCLYCTVTSLPPGLAYQGETLDFRLPRESRQHHADKYSVHLMTQLCRFMIYHHKICARAPWLHRANKEPSPAAAPGEDRHDRHQSTSEWSNYMNASDEIVTVVRSSSRDHYRYVNPFLVNTLWFAAAVQCACRVFGPPSFNIRLAGSNLDLLKLTIDRFVEFWGGMESLKVKLARIETGLHNLMKEGAAPEQHRPGREGGERERERQEGLRGAAASLVQMAVGSSSGGGSGTGEIGAGAMTSSAQVGMGASEQQPLLGIGASGEVGSGGGHGGMATGSSPWPGPAFSVVPDYLCDFTQPFTVTGHHFYGADPMDLSPFGLEEVLMAGMDSQFRGGFPNSYRM